jgi:hypothetical protein
MAFQRGMRQRELHGERLDALSASLGRRFLEGPVPVQGNWAADGAIGTEPPLAMFHIKFVIEESPP